jgi:S-adenosylmethionine-dependent methyltransferase
MVLAQGNALRLHELGRPLRVLDAGGGNGLNTEWLLREGHRVTLLDSDPAMLEQARLRLEETRLEGRCRIVQGTVEAIAEALPGEEFDLVVCHHVVEYLSDPVRAIAQFHVVAARNAELSLITLNPVSEVIRAVVFRGDPQLATVKLTDDAYDAKWFGDAKLYHMAEIVDWCAGAGWTLKDFRAIRVLADYIPDESYSDTKVSEMTSLEERLAGLEPYRRFGRYLQFCFRKLSAEGATEVSLSSE